MRVFTLNSELWLPRPLDELFPFFADARNLETLTPPWLRFEVLTLGPVTMAAGARIDYRLRLSGIPVRWQSEITVWEPPYRFINEQVVGSYRLWIHEHRFTEKNGTTLVKDFVRYAVHGGAIVNRLLVARDLRRIFAYCRQQMQSIFGTLAEESGPSNGGDAGPQRELQAADLQIR